MLCCFNPLLLTLRNKALNDTTISIRAFWFKDFSKSATIDKANRLLYFDNPNNQENS